MSIETDEKCNKIYDTIYTQVCNLNTVISAGQDISQHSFHTPLKSFPAHRGHCCMPIGGTTIFPSGILLISIGVLLYSHGGTVLL